MPPDAPNTPDAQKVLKETGDKLKTMAEADKKDLSTDAKLKIEKGEVKALYEEAYGPKDKPIEKPTDDQKLLQKAIEMAINQVAKEQKLDPIVIQNIISEPQASEITASGPLTCKDVEEALKGRITPELIKKNGRIPDNDPTLQPILAKLSDGTTKTLQLQKLLPFLEEISQIVKNASTDDKKIDQLQKTFTALNIDYKPNQLNPIKTNQLKEIKAGVLTELQDGKYGNDTHTAVLLYLKWQELNIPEPEPEKPEIKVPPLERKSAPQENKERIPEGAAFSVLLTKEIMRAKEPNWFTSADGKPIPEGKTIFYKMDPSGQMMSFVEGMNGNKWVPSELNTRKTYQNLKKGVVDKDRTHAAQGETKEEIANKFRTNPDNIKEYKRERKQNLESNVFEEEKPNKLKILGFEVDPKNSSITLNPEKKMMLLNPDGKASITTELGDRSDGSKIVRLGINGNEITIRRESKAGPDGISQQYEEHYKVVSEKDFMKDLSEKEEQKKLDLAKEGKKISEGINNNLGLKVSEINKQGNFLDISAGQLTMRIHEGAKDTIIGYLVQNKEQINNILKKPENKLNIELLINSDKPSITLKGIPLNPDDLTKTLKKDFPITRTVVGTDGVKRQVEVGRGNFDNATGDTIFTKISEADKTISENSVKIKFPSKIGKEVNAYKISKPGEPEKYSLISEKGTRITFTPSTSSNQRFVLEPKPQDFHFDDTNLTTLTGYEGNTHRWSTKRWTFNILENSPYAFKTEPKTEKINKSKKEEEKTPDKTTPPKPKPKAVETNKKDPPKTVEIKKDEPDKNKEIKK